MGNYEIDRAALEEAKGIAVAGLTAAKTAVGVVTTEVASLKEKWFGDSISDEFYAKCDAWIPGANTSLDGADTAANNLYNFISDAFNF